MEQTEKERKQDELKAKNTIRGLIIFPPIVLAILTALGVVGYNVCGDTPVNMDKALLFIPLIAAESALLLIVGIIWYKAIKDPKITQEEEKEGTVKRLEIEPVYIAWIIFVGTAFTGLAGILCVGAMDFLANTARELQGVDPVAFVALSLAYLMGVIVTLSFGAIFIFCVVHFKDMQTVEEKSPAAQPPVPVS